MTQTVKKTQCAMWGLRIEQPSDDDIASALVGDTIRSNGVGKAVVGFREPIGVAKSVKNAAEVEGVRTVAEKAEAVE